MELISYLIDLNGCLNPSPIFTSTEQTGGCEGLHAIDQQLLSLFIFPELLHENEDSGMIKLAL